MSHAWRDSQRREPAHHVRAIAGQRRGHAPTHGRCSTPARARTGSSRASLALPARALAEARSSSPAAGVARRGRHRQRRRRRLHRRRGLRPVGAALEERAPDRRWRSRPRSPSRSATAPPTWSRRRAARPRAWCRGARRSSSSLRSWWWWPRSWTSWRSGRRRASGAGPGGPPGPRPPPRSIQATSPRDGLLDGREQHLTRGRREHDDHAEGRRRPRPSRRSRTPCALLRRRRRGPARLRRHLADRRALGQLHVQPRRRLSPRRRRRTSGSRSSPPPPRPARSRRGPTPAMRVPPQQRRSGRGRHRESAEHAGVVAREVHLVPDGTVERWTTSAGRPVPRSSDPVVIAAFEGWNDAGDAATHRGPLPRRPVGRRAGRRRRPRGVLRLHLHPSRGATRRRRAPRDRVARHRDLRRHDPGHASRTCC